MKQNNNLTLILEGISKAIPVYILPFLVPIFFLPITTEFFELNKLTLIILSTILLTILWAIRLMLGKKIELAKSILDFPLVIFTGVYALSTVFSMNKPVSIFGSQGRWLGLFSLIVFVIYYYIATPLYRDPKAIKSAIYAFLIGTGIATFVSVLSYFNIFISSTAYMKLQNFSFYGGTTQTALFAALSIVMALVLIAYEKNVLIKIGLVGATILSILYVSLTSSLAAWALLVVGIVGMVFYVDLSKVFKEGVYYLAILGTTAAMAIVFLVPATRNVIVNPNFPKELSLPVRESWVVASSTIQNFPLLATGPSTFQTNFTRFRPMSLNATEFWNVRFDIPFNEIFNIIATVGILGLLATIFLVSRLMRLANQTKFTDSQEGLTEVLSLSLVALLSSFLFTYATVASTFMLVTLVALLVAAHTYIDEHSKVAQISSVGAKDIQAVASLGDSSAINKEYSKYIFGTVIILAVIYGGYLWGKNYMAEFYMRRAVIALLNNDGAKVYENQRLAITTNPTRDSYYNSFAQTDLALANNLAGKENLTDAEKQTIQSLISEAIITTRVTTEAINPLSASNWETRALIYRSILNVADNASEWAVSAYNTAIQLDPTNPRLRLDLGGMYYAQKDYLSAANQFRLAFSLKPDYANAYYNFAQSMVQLNDLQSAKQAFEITKTLVDADSEDAKLLDKEIAAVDEKIKAAGATGQVKPTVEQITASQNQGPTPQEPLIKAGEEQQINGQNLDLGTLPEQE
ncbi:hypothetical protein A2380_02330 [candidate division WWE3 bacterium RIFOXYB1_FULL_43_24]|uniref:Uncharacterized protein n=2 Tax=Katanobacteria TaxID=422282 RepID=A0A0G1BI77_UNCKA|nr:MAG: hypothetical protein UU92_C0013G0031 [candidate division WWE3 bacterium GW2011_GWA1_42_12]KKS37123.1 MAG: hypothetical protein UV00_C0017G0016 [candidate division WWE3 bacterium GW2011_GWF1_42_14]KKS39738.1 MAG: hypothetical protein UV03_C0022G0011 [candidate division WWE3 bacterium GW2011_GWE1_42_16]KKS66666.1 MAG: hypothetical protein UV35_C0010G0014 [candidate division WWE3 bacterium GW2011_GWB1_42_6]OGC68773.1 MAG: hypothetical protein A2380_02330 [candidate division WWE3 bacterium 